jgi:hypothetical protein
MPFEKGHPHYPGIHTGSNSEQRRALRSLAMSIREGVHPDQIRDWLVEIWRGRDPLTGEAVELKNRAAALQMLLDRGWGQAAQHVVIEGEIRNEVIQIAPKDARPAMTLEEINQRRRALREAGVVPKMIDVESAPTKNADDTDE